MANQNILDLPELTELTDTDLLFVQGTTAGTATIEALREAGAGIANLPDTWPVMSPLTASDNAMRLQIRIDEFGQNVFSVWAVGAYQVDWGDGTITSYGSSVTATHTYTYSTLSADVIIEGDDNYKVVEINVTPTGATWTGVSIAQRPSAMPSSAYANNPILNLEIAGSNLTTIYIAAQSGAQQWIPRFLRRVAIRSCSTSTQVGSTGSMFASCGKLEEIVAPSTMKLNSAYRLYSYCVQLEKTPLLDLSACTTIAFMHEYCRNLKYPADVYANVTTTAESLWYACSALKTLPHCYHPLATNYTYYMASCTNLQQFSSAINFSAGTNFQSFAPYLYSIGDALATSNHIWPTSGITSMVSAFYDSRITVLPEIGTIGCTDFTSLLGLGNSGYLTSIPASYNFASALVGKISLASTYITKWIYATPPTVSHSIGYNALSKAAIDDWFTRLPIIVGQTVTVTGNPGASTCDTSIAMLKGWIVVT